jgi:alkylation response protein AidB-like acyl-CoA dehydrogenase
MIDFTLTDEQREFRELAHRFAEKEMRPVAADYDEREEMAWDVLKKAAQVGLLSYAIPEEYGGGGADSVLMRCIVDEELFWGCAGIATAMGGSMLAAMPILLAGSPDQKAQYLPRFCDPAQVRLGAFALTEPGAGSDPGALATLATRDGDDYLLNGQKCFITNGGIADLYVVFATLDRTRGVDGVTTFLVESHAAGVSGGKKEKKMGIRSSHTAIVNFENVRVPASQRLGAEGEGFKIAMRTFDRTRTHIAAGAVGIARAAYEFALGYSQERKQFGKPIGSFQAISFMLAEMAMELDAARLLAWRSAWLADTGQTCTAEASMAKAFAADVAMKTTTNAVQILGGYGYSREYPVEKWMRDAKIMQIYEGTAQIQRLIISRRLGESKR